MKRTLTRLLIAAFALPALALPIHLIGTRWVIGEDHVKPNEPFDFPIPKMTPQRKDAKPFEYVEAPSKIPFYPPSEKWGTVGDPLKTMQLPLSAEESLKHMVVSEGFKVELFAGEPDIGKAIAMNWDERGRLWVCETVDYPNQLRAPGKGRDRIRICEDTDGDGRADKFTVFAEQLSIPTAITFYQGGVIVQAGTQTLYLKDTDGDDRADLRKVLIDNWNMSDTHGGVSNFRYGLDNWIWAMQGYNNSQPVINGKPHNHSFRMGFFRFRLDGKDPPSVIDLEFIRSTNNNTWGLGISEEGLIFGSTANRNPSVYMSIPNRYYERVAGWAPEQLNSIADTHLFKPITQKIRQVDHHGGYTAGAGHALYTARTYPEEYWNRTAFVCGPTGKLVGTFVLQPDGAGFRSTSPFNLLASDDEWTAPIMAEVGPDGHVWVIDWYNYIVQHNPTPRGFETGKGNAYETDLRDKRHGRIYRVVYEPAKPHEPFSLAAASPEKLVETLKHDNMFWRLHAQRLLVERGKDDVADGLFELLTDSQVDEIGLHTGAIHALWTLHELAAFSVVPGDTVSNHIVACLSHPSAGVRRNAVATLPSSVDSAKRVIPLLDDVNAQVRLAALLKIADIPQADDNLDMGQAIATTLDRPENVNDRWIVDAATSAAAVCYISYLTAAADLDQFVPQQLDVCRIVAEHMARSERLDDDSDANRLDRVIRAISVAKPPVAEAIIAGLSHGWPRDRTVQLRPDTEEAIKKLSERLPSNAKTQLVQLAVNWGSEWAKEFADELITSLLATISDETKADADRIAAARQAIGLRPSDESVIKQILVVVTPRSSPALAGGMIESLAASDSDTIARQLMRRMSRWTPSAKTAAIRVLLARPRWTMDMLTAAENGIFSLSELTLDQKQSLSTHANRRIAHRAKELLASGGGLPNPDRQKVLEQLLPLAEQTGDVAAGKRIFEKQCAKCHMYGGEGNRIGPDLTGMAVHSKEELLTQILDPSRSVEGNYRQYSVITIEGRVLTGLLAGETKTSVEMFDAEGKKHVVLRDNIDELRASSKSLMPDGFEKETTAEDLINLLEFLTSRPPDSISASQSPGS